MRLNLGCGKDIKEGYINIDRMNIGGVDLVCELEDCKLPFEDSTVEEVQLNHILEHIFNLEQLLKELYRVCKDKAVIEIRTPYFSHESAFSCYQHIRRFTWTTFEVFNPTHAEHFHSDLKIEVVKKELRGRFLGKWTPFNLFPRLYQEYLCWIIPTKEIYYKLRILK